MSLLGDLIVRIGADTTQFQTGMAEVNRQLGHLDHQLMATTKGFDMIGMRLQTMGRDMMMVGATMTAAISVPLIGLGAAALKASGFMEQTTVAFTTMAKSADVAKAHLEELKKFTLVTPFQFEQVAQASRLIQAYGTNIKDVIPRLRIIGDATASLGGGAERLERVVRSIGEIGTRGRITGEQLRELSRAGINALEALAQKIGKTEAEVQEMVTAKAVSAEVALDALFTYMEKRFGGGMEELSKTMLGKWSNIKDRLFFVFAQIGDALKPTAVAMIDAVDPILQKVGAIAKAFSQLPEPIQAIAGALGVIAVAAGPAVLVLGVLANSIGSIVKLLPLVAPGTAAFVALSTAIISVTVAAGALLSAFRIKELVAESEALADAWKGIKGLFTSAASESQAVDALGKALDDAVKNFQALKDSGKANPRQLALAEKEALEEIFKYYKYYGVAISEAERKRYEQLKGILAGYLEDVANRIKNALSGLNWTDFFSPGVFAVRALLKELDSLYEMIQNLRGKSPTMDAAAIEGLKKLAEANMGVTAAALQAMMAHSKLSKSVMDLTDAYKTLGVKPVEKLDKMREAIKAIAQAVKEHRADPLDLVLAYDALEKAIAKLPTALNRAYEALKITSVEESARNLEKARTGYEALVDAFEHGKATIADVDRGFYMLTQQEEAFTRASGHVVESNTLLDPDLWPLVSRGMDEFTAALLLASERATGFDDVSRKNAETLNVNLKLLNEVRLEFDKLALSTENVMKRLEALQGAFPPLTGYKDQITELQKAFDSLGDASKNKLGQRVDQAVKNLQVLTDSGIASARELALAEKKALEEIFEWYKWYGVKIPEAEQQRYNQLKTMLGEHVKAQESAWKQIGNEINAAMRRMSRQIADAIVEWKGFGETVVDVAKSMAKAILTILIEQGTAKLILSLKSVLDHFGAIGKALENWAGKMAGVKIPAGIPTSVPTPGIPVPTAPGASAPTGGTAPTGAGVGASMGGWMGATDAIGSAVSAITGVLQYLQSRRMEQDIGRIEVTSRGILNQVVSIQETLNSYLPGIKDIHAFLWDPLATYLGEILNATLGKGDSAPSGMESALDMIDAKLGRIIEILYGFQDRLKAGVSSAVDSGLEALSNAAEKTVEVVSGLGRAALEVTGNIARTGLALAVLSTSAAQAARMSDRFADQLQSVPNVVQETFVEAARRQGWAIADTTQELIGAAGKSLLEYLESVKDRINQTTFTVGDAINEWQRTMGGQFQTFTRHVEYSGEALEKFRTWLLEAGYTAEQAAAKIAAGFTVGVPAGILAQLEAQHLVPLGGPRLPQATPPTERGVNALPVSAGPITPNQGELLEDFLNRVADALQRPVTGSRLSGEEVSQFRAVWESAQRASNALDRLADSAARTGMSWEEALKPPADQSSQAYLDWVKSVWASGKAGSRLAGELNTLSNTVDFASGAFVTAGKTLGDATENIRRDMTWEEALRPPPQSSAAYLDWVKSVWASGKAGFRLAGDLNTLSATVNFAADAFTQAGRNAAESNPRIRRDMTWEEALHPPAQNSPEYADWAASVWASGLAGSRKTDYGEWLASKLPAQPSLDQIRPGWEKALEAMKTMPQSYLTAGLPSYEQLLAQYQQVWPQEYSRTYAAKGQPTTVNLTFNITGNPNPEALADQIVRSLEERGITF